MEDKFVVGETYFEFGFIDTEFNFPLITSFVYIGKNIMGDSQGDTWYFQDPDSYMHSSRHTGPGRAVANSSSAEDKLSGSIASYSEHSINELLNMNQLIEELKLYNQNRNAWRSRGA
jgi:hypothetical protein